MSEQFFLSFWTMLSPETFVLLFAGSVIGIVVGAIPGLNGGMLVALSLPLTFGWNPLNAIALLVGQYVGSMTGGLVSATLLNIPGSPSNLMTTLDANPMARDGKAERALQLGILASFIGGLVSWFALVLLSPPIARMALALGPHEYFALVFAALMLISSLSSGSVIRALIAATLGMLCALPGLDMVTGQPRLTFDFSAMLAGFDLLAVLVGVFAVTQLLDDTRPQLIAERFKVSSVRLQIGIKDLQRHGANFMRSSLIGTWIGILPGVGGSVGSIVSYTVARNFSKKPDEFGKGAEEGVVASETANNATIGGALIPLVTMGIPGSVIDVILIAALTLHNIRPGPLLFQTNPDIVYAFMSSMFIANLIVIAVMLMSIRWIARVIDVPKAYLISILLVFCVVGTFAVNNRMFDVWVMLAFGLIGLAFKYLRFPLPPFVIGFILTPIAEGNLRAALIASEGDWSDFVTRPLSGILLLSSALILAMPLLRRRRSVV